MVGFVKKSETVGRKNTASPTSGRRYSPFFLYMTGGSEHVAVVPALSGLLLAGGHTVALGGGAQVEHLY